MYQRSREDEYIHRVGLLKQERGVFNALWDEVSSVVRPEAASFTGTANNPGQKTGQKLYDAVGVHSCQLLAAGFYSLLTNPQTPWFELTTTNPVLRDRRDVQIWLKQVTKIMLTEIQRPQTGFQTAQHEFYLDFCGYGNGTMFVTMHPDRSTLLFNALPLQECYYVEGPDGRVAALYRIYTRTVQQLWDRFGYDNLAKEVKDMLDNGQYDSKVNVVHVVEPNRYANKSYAAKHLPYASVYLDLDHKHIMSESGFEEQPFMAARFQKTSYEVYGRGPGAHALCDLKSLQEVMKTTLRGAQKAVDPPLIVPDKAFLTPLRTMPGGISYYRPDNPNDKVTPLVSGAQPQWGFETAEGIRNRVRQMFFVDQLQLNEGPQMTATEVLQRTEEKMRLMGPILGRAMTELLSPCLERVFHLLMRAGHFPEPPSIFFEEPRNLRIVYTSPIAKAQDQTEANSWLRVAQLVSPLMSVDPSVMDVFDGEFIARNLGNMYSLDPRSYRSEEEVSAIRQARMQSQQQEQTMQMLQAGSGAFNSFTGGMKNMQGLQ